MAVLPSPADAARVSCFLAEHLRWFILTAGGVTVESTALAFAGKEPPGYVSDHIGLRARLSLAPTG